MAGSSDGNSGGAGQLPKSDTTTVTIKSSNNISRRQLTLISITVCLHVLLWSSLVALVVAIYLIVSDPEDSTNTPSEAMTLTSALASVAYILLHTIFSLKQRIWRHQRRHPALIKKTSYVAIRSSVTLCVLWLLTSGWNLITVARRPVCMPAGPGRKGWEAGPTCLAGRVGIAMALIALLASCTVFGMLALVPRPFEAHLLKYGSRKRVNPQNTPVVSRRPSLSRSASFASDKYQGRVSVSTHRSTPSNYSNADVGTLDLNSASPPSTINSPSPIRSMGTGMFTSQSQLPRLPLTYIHPRSTSLKTLPPPTTNPTVSFYQLAPHPHMSSLIAPSGFVPLTTPYQYSASLVRAVHPIAPSPLCPFGLASRSQPHLPYTAHGRSRYSRSSISLTRPHRLSTTTPAGSVAWSSRSGSTGPGDKGRGNPSSSSLNDRATANAIAYAILHGTSVPGTEVSRERKGHIRHASAPDATIIAQQAGRKAKGWKPQLKEQVENIERLAAKIRRASSAEQLSRFSLGSSPENNEVDLRKELENQLDLRRGNSRALPFRKTRSASALRHSDVPAGIANINQALTMGTMPQDVHDPKSWHVDYGPSAVRAGRPPHDEMKYKPLPRIAAL